MPKYDEREEDSSFAGKFKGFYYKLEDSYYAFLDKLHDAGVDLYKYFVEPIESRGVPSFPVAIALLLVILGGAFLAFTGLPSFGPTGTLAVTLSAQDGSSLDNIPVILVVEGRDFATQRTQDGIAMFQGVPLNKPAKIRINHPNYGPVLQDVSLSNSENAVQISLSSAGPDTHDFLVTVVDSLTGSPVRDAAVSFQSLATGLEGTVSTQPDGTAVLQVDSLDSIITININADNFEATQRSALAGSGQLTVQLIPVIGDLGNGGDQPLRGSVVVSVTDEQGNNVAANVQLFEENSSIALASDNVESGVARFESVAPVGTNLYAVINPLSEEFLQAQSTIGQLTAEEDLAISVQLQSATAATSQVISLNVVSDAGNAVENAYVAIFSADTNQLIASQGTDADGQASFTLSSSILLESFYVAVNAEGYLPLISTISSRSASLELQTAAAGNNAEFDGEALDPDNEPAAGTKIELADASGRLYGITQFAGPNGKATFTGVPVDTSLRLFGSLDGAAGQSDIFEVAFSENSEKVVTLYLERATGTMLVRLQDLVNGQPVENGFITAYADSPIGAAVANCTTVGDGSCFLEKVWANRDIYLVAEATGFDSSTSSVQFVLPSQTKHINVFVLSQGFRDQTIINLVSLVDDKGREVLNFPTIERGKIYTARFAASFANGSQHHGIYLRVGDAPTVDSDEVIIKSFEYSPSSLGSPVAMHSVSYNPGDDCSVDLLNNDVNNEGKKWVQVEYQGVAGVVELTARVFVRPTADAAQDKLLLHYRAFAVQNGKYSRNPFDDELGLDRKSQSKDECYASTIDKEFSLVEGSSVCNDAGTACIAVSFTSPAQLEASGSPFIGQLNRPFSVNYEVRNFGPVEGSSAYVKLVSPSGLAKFSEYSGVGTASFDEPKTTVRVLLGDALDVYTGGVTSTGVIPADFVPFAVEFGDARGVIASHSRAFAVIQGNGALSLTQITPTEFEVGKVKDLRVTVKTSAGEPITDATLFFEEENGSPFDGNVPSQVAGDGTPANGENGQYAVKRIKPISPGTFKLTVSRDRFAPVSQIFTSRVSSFFEFDQPDFISLSCNATTLRVRNTLDVEVTADVYVDPTCVSISGPGINQVAAQGGQSGTSHYRIPNFKPGRTRLLSLQPNSNSSCQVEVSATDPRTGTRSLDDPIQIENTCTTYGGQASTDANGIVYINGNVFQPPRLLVDTFSRMFYGSFAPPNQWDPRYADAASYASAPVGGYNSFYQRAGVIDPATGQPVSQYMDQRNAGLGMPPQGAVGVPREAALGGQVNYGTAGVPDPYGGGSAFDIRRANFQSNWTIAWVNQDPVPHSFKCTDRGGNTIVQVDSLAPQATHVQVISKPGLYRCKLENTNTGTVKIKSMCPKKGALYYTRLITRCMARKAIGDTGLFDGGKQHAAKVAASVKTRFIAFQGNFQVGQTDKPTKVDCKGIERGAECKLRVTPLVPRNGFAFAIEDRTGKPDYLIRIKPEGTLDPSCFKFDQLDKVSSYRALLQPVVSGVSAIGLTSAPAFATFAIKFNEKDNCVKIRPSGNGKNFAPYLWNPREGKFLPGEGYALFELQSNANPNVRYTVKLVIEPWSLLDGRFLFTTVPTTVGNNKLFYRTGATGDPREPGFVVNNLPEEKVGLFPLPGQGTAAVVNPGTIGVMSGNEPPQEGKLRSISAFKDGFYLCTENGGCVARGTQAEKLTPFNAVKPEPDMKDTAMQLGDVIGNYKFESAPATTPDDDKPFVCSGVNYCSAGTEAGAVDLAQKKVEDALKAQYEFVETFDVDSTMDNMQDSLTTCIQEALAEIAAQEVQYQMCKTLADMCGGASYLDPEEEEVEEGESFASGITLDAVLGDSKTIVKDIICQETEAGQNLQALRGCLQPGNRACRDLIASRIAGNLKQAQVKSVAVEQPVVDIQNPVINFVTKRIQDNPKAAEANIADQVAVGGYNVYRFTADYKQFIGGQGDKAREEGTVIFETRPPGYDFSKAIAGVSSGLAGAAFAPFRLPGAIYDWATATGASPESNKLRSVSLGFPYVVSQGVDTHVEFDKFQPTLLTLNKYPLMRSVDMLTREKKDDTSAVAFAAKNCTIENRPVDPLQLFDACEDLRPNQANYDALTTDKKAPFAKSLVFQAVPARSSQDPLTPVWPPEYSQASFQVAIPPEYEFASRGETISGASAPAVAHIPIIGSLLYSAGAVSKQFETLSIPAQDIKRYAVQVTSCAYTRDVLKGNAIILDPSVKNNCNVQWQIGAMYAGSNGNSLEMEVGGVAQKCDGRQACVAIQLTPTKSLRIATVDGVNGAIAGTPSSKLKGGAASVGLNEVAQDLLRYYTDESYVPTTFNSVYKEAANKCELKASANEVLLKCGESAEDLAKPFIIDLYLARNFVKPAAGATDFTFKVGTGASAPAESFHGVPFAVAFYKEPNKKPTCFEPAGKDVCTAILGLNAASVDKIGVPGGPTADMSVDLPFKDAYIVFGSLIDVDGVEKIVGFKKKNGAVVKDFELIASSVKLTAGAETGIEDIEKTLYTKLAPVQGSGTSQVVTPNVGAGDAATFSDEGLSALKFVTAPSISSEAEKTAAVNVHLGLKRYTLHYRFGDSVSKLIGNAIQASRLGIAGSVSLVQWRNILSSASRLTVTECTAGSEKFYVEVWPMPFGWDSLEDLTVKPPQASTMQFNFPAEITSCKSTFEIPGVGKAEVTASPVGDNVFNFNFAATPISNVPPALGSGTCNAVGDLVLTNENTAARTGFLKYRIELDTSGLNALQKSKLSGSQIRFTQPWKATQSSISMPAGSPTVFYTENVPIESAILSPAPRFSVSVVNGAEEVCGGVISPNELDELLTTGPRVDVGYEAGSPNILRESGGDCLLDKIALYEDANQRYKVYPLGDAGFGVHPLPSSTIFAGKKVVFIRTSASAGAAECWAQLNR